MICSVVLSLVIMLSIVDGKTFKPSTSEELTLAIKESRSGDVIQLLPKNYEGSFLLETKEEGGSTPVVLRGTHSKNGDEQTAIISKTKAFAISGGHWDIQNLNIQSEDVGVEVIGSGNKVNFLVIHAAKLGVVVEGDDNVLRSLVINGGSQGVVLKGARTEVRSISMQGVRDNGIFVKSGSTNTEINSVSCHMADDDANAFTLQSNTSKTNARSCVFNGISYISSDANQFRGCVFAYVNLEGCGNFFKSATIRNVYISDKCQVNNRFESTVFMQVDDPIQ